MQDRSTKIISMLGRNLLLPYYKKKYGVFLKSLKHTTVNQENFLLWLVKRSQETDFGRKYRFSKISTLGDFRNALPIFEYHDLEPYLTRVANGEFNALIPSGEKILAFGSTTGTTGTPKRMPITRTWLNNYQKWWQMWGVRALCDHPNIIGKHWLQISGPSDLDITNSGHNVGMVSAISAKYQNQIFQLFYSTPRELSDLRDSELRQYIISRLSMAQSIGFIITITAANLITLAEVGNKNKEKIIKDIHDGTLEGLSEISSPTLRSKIESRLKPLKKRARQLEDLLKDHSELYPKHYWDTELITCWTGGTVGYQTQKLHMYYGDCALRDIGYISTEGRHTITLSENNPAGPLITDGAFYEFMPLGSSQTFLPHELEIGQEYIVLVTTSNGLYRYKFDDIISCRGYMESTPIIEFMRKTSDYSDLEGEKLSAQQIITAVREITENNNLQFFEFGLWGERRQDSASRYQIYLEPPEDLQSNTQILSRLIEDIDKHLIKSNLIYRQKRSDGSLDRLDPVILPRGTWKKLMISQAEKRKTGETQYKHPVFLTQQMQQEISSLMQ